jgi:hypothetical protein
VRGATWRALWQRLTVSKSKRVAVWREAMSRRLGRISTESR